MSMSNDKLPKTDIEWQERLTPEQYRVCRQKGTDLPFHGEYVNCHKSGVYHCVCCGQPLFSSQTKYESGSGWPSYYAPLDTDVIASETDHSHGMDRVEIHCSRCQSHLGHLFPDGPAPTGMRYCINSTALKLESEEKGC